MSVYAKPLPKMSEASRPFWEAAKRHEVVAQECSACKHLWLPPASACPNCLSTRFGWRKLSGRGKVWSFVIFHRVYIQAFSKDIPYNVAYVDLDEGPGVTTNLVGVKNEDIKVGMPVEVVFDDVTDEITLLKFRPILGS